ncbi:ankyrin repeat protein [Colletotrichum camelliae]|nr:ankyrin repeat protein [Colletotrichum camelliae]
MSEAKPALPNLWTKAAETLRNDPEQEKRDLINRYFEIVQSDLGTADATRIDVAKHLNAKVEELNERRLKITWGSHEANVKAVFNSVAKHIIAAKDLITSAASSDPNAALACAGGLVLLTFLIRPIEQREQLLGGLELTSSIVARHAEFDPRSRMSCLANQMDTLEEDLEDNLVKLYAKIMELQARALCYVQRERISQFVHDMFRGPTWKELVSEIKSLDPRSREPGTLVFQERVHLFLDETERLRQEEEAETLRLRRTRLLKTLDTCPYEDRKNINADRAPGTCEWFTQHPYFQDWDRAAQPGLLWVSADPGCGKSVLSKYLVDDALQSDNRIVCYFFFKDDFDDQKNAAGAICAMLRQLLEKNRDLMEDSLLYKFESSSSTLLQSVNSLFNLLIRLSNDCKQEIVCVLDALDECNDKDRHWLIAELIKTYLKPMGNCNIRFLVTTRPYIDIQRAFQILENTVPTIHLKGEDEDQINEIAAEIDIFIRKRVAEISQSIRLESSETQYLEQRMVRVKNRTYLWVKLALDVIQNILSFTKDTVEEALNQIPEGLDRLYERILSRSADGPMAKRVIHVILAAREPLSVSDMSVVFAIRDRHLAYSDIQLEPEDRFVNTLRATCGLFVTIINGEVYFLHQTAREFLLQQPSEGHPETTLSSHDFVWRHKFSLQESHATLAKVCVQLRFMDTRARVHWNRPKIGFYAEKSWIHHCNQADYSTINDLSELTVQLCHLLTDGKSSGLLQEDVPPLKTPLFVAICLGLDGTVKYLLDNDLGAIFTTGEQGETTLYSAAVQGHNSIVRIILAADRGGVSDALANKPSCDGDTPLRAAMMRRHADVVRSLLEDNRTRLDAELFDETGSKYFESMIRFADESSLDLLFGDHRWHKLNESQKWAMLRKYLSQRDLDSIRTNAIVMNMGPVAVWYAAHMQESLEAFRHLVETVGLSPDVRGPDGQTPLYVCALSGYVEAILILVNTNHVNVNSSNGYNSTPLMAISYWSSTLPEQTVLESVIRLLLQKGADLEAKNIKGRTALMYAVMNGNHLLVQFYIEQGAMMSQATGYSKQTQFSRAATHLSKNRLKILWNTGNVNVDASDLNRQTPLVHAILSGNRGKGESTEMVETVELQISIGADVNHKDIDLRTALMHAAKAGFKHVAQTLVGHGASLNVEDVDGKTALMLARAGKESIGVFERLMGDQNAKRDDHEAIIEFLLTAEAKDKTERKSHGISADYDEYSYIR